MNTFGLYGTQVLELLSVCESRGVGGGRSVHCGGKMLHFVYNSFCMTLTPFPPS